jgi:polyisoprenoid-binding protein YceI
LTLIVGAAIGLAAALAPRPAPAQQVVAAQSEIAFTTRQMGVPVDGRFRRFEAKAAFDPKRPEAARIEITVDLASASIGTAETEAELAKPDWFDTPKFPSATFRSQAVRSLGPGRYEVTGTFTLKGQSRPVTVPVAWAQTGDSGTAEGSFALKRLEFGVGVGEWKDPTLVADEVRVRFRLRLAGVAAP